jgi:hypothetical protein
MPSKRSFYQTKVTITVLSDEPMSSDLSLQDISYEIDEGDWLGDVSVGASKKIDAERCAQLCDEACSDPSFFGLDADGNDTED